MAKKEEVKGETSSEAVKDSGVKEDAKPKRSGVKEEADTKQIADEMKAMLDTQPKVQVYIPLLEGEPKGTQLPVEINGHKMFVPKGVPGVEVPQSVAEIVWQSLGIYDEASAALRSQNDPNRPLRLDLQSASDKKAIDA